jgi:hypothetical protein
MNILKILRPIELICLFMGFFISEVYSIKIYFIKIRYKVYRFHKSIFISLSNLALTVGVIMPVEHDIAQKDIRPSFNYSLIMVTLISVRLNGTVMHKIIF